MLAWLLRMGAALSLALAVVLAVLDASRSVAADALVLTPLGDSLARLSAEAPGILLALGGEGIAGDAVRLIAEAILARPGFAVFGVLALLLYMMGYRRPDAPFAAIRR